MNTLVMNLDNLAVTEYTTALTGLSGDYETTTAGVFKVNGSLDVAAKIASSFTFGLLIPDTTRLRRAKYIYIHGTGGLEMTATITDSAGNTYAYDSIFRHGRAARFTLGAGIRDGYLKVTLASAGDAPFIIDRISFETPESDNRRL